MKKNGNLATLLPRLQPYGSHFLPIQTLTVFQHLSNYLGEYNVIITDRKNGQNYDTMTQFVIQ